jgi:hypothetical protein
MQDLTPVGLSKDGTRLLLVSSAGEEFAVAVDTRLRAALRGENARLSQLEMKMESALRPRDIQARIRAGESPDEVAAAAQTTVEAIMGFATPVLAERAHVARTALRASVRRRSGESSSAGRTLGEAAELFFADHTLHEEDVEWDAWRRPDGRWALVAAYAVGGRPHRAEFTHDLPGRYVVAENDDARVLTGELRQPESRAAGTRARPSQTRRLSPVPREDELPLGDDAIELVRDRESSAAAPAPAADSEGLEDVADAEAARADAPHAAEDLLSGADTADADWLVEERVDTDDRAAAAETAEDEPSDEPSQEPTDEADAPERAEPRPRKKSRASVPSWDEIMFGGGKGD